MLKILKMFKLKFLFGLIFFFPTVLNSQNSFYGKVLDESTGNALPGAHVVIDDDVSAVTGTDGVFTIKGMFNGTHKVKVSYIGFEAFEKELKFNGDANLDIQLKPATILEEVVTVVSTRADLLTPSTKSNISKKTIQAKNAGQDLPYILEMSPSVVTTSDAGAGIGYTGLRIRGTDQFRINMTLNGIPLNDAESHGVWWVNMPDFASSLNNIQIQRGVGTSANGAAAFGASINMNSSGYSHTPFVELNNTYGSFNSLKNTIILNSGLLKNKWSFETRLSRISTDGFIDRASSDLKSFYAAGGYYGKKSMVKFYMLSGKEKTYQAWNGVPKVRLENDLEGMQRYADHWLISQQQANEMINSENRTYNLYTYDNETDNYQQDHYQLHYSYKLNYMMNLNIAGHYTRGRGYYEQYRDYDDFALYGLNDIIIGSDTITHSNLIRQKWLDNDFYGTTWSLNFDNRNRIKVSIGGAWNKYQGDHFGNIIWAQYASNMEKDYEWYFNKGTKTDFNVYGKVNYRLTQKLNAYGDVQYRIIDYEINGLHDDLRDISQKHEYNFVNPKAGVSYLFNSTTRAYASFAVANREPSRTSFRDADPGEVPNHETLYDYEVGFNKSAYKYFTNINFYYMNYKDQLVLTGEINNVGDPKMTNVKKSFRTGLELEAGWRFRQRFVWKANATFSSNKIKDFTAYVDDWDNGGQVKTELGTTNIAFSPNLIAANSFEYRPISNATIEFTSKYVGEQYIDNTSNDSRKLDAYLVNNLKLTYQLKQLKFTKAEISLLINNILNKEYESNAWVYRYYYFGEYWNMDGYFPQAGRNFLLTLNIKI
jgi:iron complex outermembrane receptor protein